MRFPSFFLLPYVSKLYSIPRSPRISHVEFSSASFFGTLASPLDSFGFPGCPNWVLGTQPKAQIVTTCLFRFLEPWPPHWFLLVSLFFVSHVRKHSWPQLKVFGSQSPDLMPKMGLLFAATRAVAFRLKTGRGLRSLNFSCPQFRCVMCNSPEIRRAFGVLNWFLTRSIQDCCS